MVFFVSSTAFPSLGILNIVHVHINSKKLQTQSNFFSTNYDPFDDGAMRLIASQKCSNNEMHLMDEFNTVKIFNLV